jgi:hypothetical protein
MPLQALQNHFSLPLHLFEDAAVKLLCAGIAQNEA